MWEINPQYAASTLPIRGEVWVLTYTVDTNTTIGYWYHTKEEAEARLILLNASEERQSPCLFMCPKCRFRRVNQCANSRRVLRICEHCGYYERTPRLGSFDE